MGDLTIFLLVGVAVVTTAIVLRLQQVPASDERANDTPLDAEAGTQWLINIAPSPLAGSAGSSFPSGHTASAEPERNESTPRPSEEASYR